MKHLILVAAFVVTACAGPLSRLSQAIETMPVPYWGYASPSSEELQDAHKRLRHIAALMGIRIELADDPVASGRWFAAERLITIDQKLGFDGQVQTVAHELAHALSPPMASADDREVFADTVAYLVVFQDRDDLETFARYLGRFRTTAPQVIRMYEKEIYLGGERAQDGDREVKMQRGPGLIPAGLFAHRAHGSPRTRTLVVTYGAMHCQPMRSYGHIEPAAVGRVSFHAAALQ